MIVLERVVEKGTTSLSSDGIRSAHCQATRPIGHTASRSVQPSNVEYCDYLLHTLALFAKNPSTDTFELELSSRKASGPHLVL